MNKLRKVRIKEAIVSIKAIFKDPMDEKLVAMTPEPVMIPRPEKVVKLTLVPNLVLFPESDIDLEPLLIPEPVLAPKLTLVPGCGDSIEQGASKESGAKANLVVAPERGMAAALRKSEEMVAQFRERS